MNTAVATATPAPTTQEPDVVSLGDKRVETSTYDRYKGRKGITDRLALISSGLFRAYTYFYEGNGQKKMFRAPTNPETLAFVKKTLGEPDQRFGVVTFQYQTDDLGQLVEPEKCKGKIRLWIWSEARYEELTNMNRQWPLLDVDPATNKGLFTAKQVDLQIKCTEEQFQRMQFTPTPLAHWKTKQAWYDAIKLREQKAIPKLKQALGRAMTDLEIMAMLGGAPVTSATGTTDNAADVDLSDVTDE